MTKRARTLASERPDLAQQWSTSNSKSPEEVSPGSQFLAIWVCPKGHDEYQCRVADRTRQNRRPSGCPRCGILQREATKQAKRLSKGSLADDHPTLASQWASTNAKSPQEVTSGSRYIAAWTCSADPSHPVYTASVKSRAKQGSGCPLCGETKKVASLRKHWVEANGSLAEKRPDLASEWNQEGNALSPYDVSPSSGYRALWNCPKDPRHSSYYAVLHNRARPDRNGTKGGTGCPACNKQLSTSRHEAEIAQFLEALHLTIEKNQRTLLDTGQELDIYVPSKRFAIEFNGVYWHSEKHKTPTYHRDKTQACARSGITLFQVWEDEWIDKRNVVLRAIAHRLGLTSSLGNVLPDLDPMFYERVGGRSLTLVEVDRAASREFLETNHLQGEAAGSVRLGLQDSGGRLRAVMVLRRGMRVQEYYLERYATAGIIPGGFSRLLKAFLKTNGPTKIVTFSDASISSGALYESHGFTLDRILPPDYSYLVGNKRRHKFAYRIKRFRNDPSLIFEEGLSESQLAKLNGLTRVWDSGKVRWVLDAT